MRLDRAVAGLATPPASPTYLVDLDAFDANAADLARRAAGTPIRLASKSVRVPALIRRALDAPGFRGVLAYALRELPVGEAGEILIHGPMVFDGYWKRPEATAAAFVELDGKRFFRSGDLGRVDEDGYFFITDRLKRMINASGFKVWPAEVEALMFKHPAIAEACVIATQDAYRGESVKAVVVLRADARGKTTEADILAWCREHMAVYKAPREVQFVDALPKSGSGKVMWRWLQEQEAARASAT